MFPPLAGNANVQSRDSMSIVRVILQGVQTVPTAKQPTASTMPAYDRKLSDDEIAAVASYVRHDWGQCCSRDQCRASEGFAADARRQEQLGSANRRLGGSASSPPTSRH